MDYSTISVVIPVRGKIELLLRALNSCIVQTKLPREIILVDDSTDSFEKEEISRIANEFRYHLNCAQINIIFVFLQSNGTGAASARNIGIKQSSGEYVAFLDADDYFLPDKIKQQFEAMKSKDADFSHTNYISMKNGLEPNLVDSSFNNGLNQDKIISFRGCSIATPTVMVRGSIAREIGEVFPVGIVVGEDQIGWVRIAHFSKKPFLHIGYSLTIVYIDQNSSSRSDINISAANDYLTSNASKMGILKPKFYQYGGVARTLRKIFPRRGKFWRAVMAAYREVKK
jgi:glycosyltransferase involved in cell wall biosynthesis